MNRNKIILENMLQEIDYLMDYANSFDYKTFINSEEKKRTVSMTLINIGETVRHLTKEFREANEDIPFDDVLGLRDVAAHGYKALRFEFLWGLIHDDVPELKTKIMMLLKTM